MKNILFTLALLISYSSIGQIITTIQDSEIINGFSMYRGKMKEISDYTILVDRFKQYDKDYSFFYLAIKYQADENTETIILNSEEVETLKKLIDNVWVKRKEKSIVIKGEIDCCLGGRYQFVNGYLILSDIVSSGGTSGLGYEPNSLIESTNDYLSYLILDLKGIKKLRKFLAKYN